MTQRQAHFIRCIKPTTTLKPGNFTPALVLQQLRCSGTIDAVQLMTSAYPTRIPYENIYSRYAQHMPDFVRALEPPLFCEALSLALEIPPSGYQLGRTKIFFKAGKGQVLEELAERDLSEVIPLLVEKIKLWEKRKAMQIKMQASARMFLKLTEFRRVKKAARFIQHRRQSQQIWVEYRKRHLAWLAKREREEAARRQREAEEKVLALARFRTLTFTLTMSSTTTRGRGGGRGGACAARRPWRPRPARPPRRPRGRGTAGSAARGKWRRRRRRPRSLRRRPRPPARVRARPGPTPRRRA